MSSPQCISVRPVQARCHFGRSPHAASWEKNDPALQSFGARFKPSFSWCEWDCADPYPFFFRSTSAAVDQRFVSSNNTHDPITASVADSAAPATTFPVSPEATKGR
jgi:hypothetical protein